MNIRTLTECLDTKLKTEAFEYEFDDELDYIMDDDSLSDEEKEQAIKDLYNKYNIDESWSDEDISSIPFSELISGNWFGAKESDYGGTVDKSFFSKWGDTEDTKYSDEDPESLDEDWDDDSLSDIEREQAISNLYSKYNLHESNSCDGWIAFYNGKKLEIPKSDVDGGIYEAKQKAIKELKVPKSKIGLLSIKPAYNESLNEGRKSTKKKFIIRREQRGSIFNDDWHEIRPLEVMAKNAQEAQDKYRRILRSRGKTANQYERHIDIKEADPQNESLTESVAGDIIWEKVRDYIQELIETEVVDNLASVVSSEIPEYNPDWCGDSSFTSQRAVEKLAEELATELMFNLE